jgi:hypothetical protein
MPERIQLKRTKGWRLPEEAVSVARPAKYGNPFAVGRPVGPPYVDASRTVRDRADAVALFIAYLKGIDPSLIRAELGGKTLACWCPPPFLDEPDICHGAALLDLAAGRRMTTPDVPLPGGGTRMHVKRCCNGCGESIGDVTDEEIDCAIGGYPLPDVRKECPRCGPALEAPNG